jgi:DNA-directed RNA polymerase specialized sigma24 family protein
MRDNSSAALLNERSDEELVDLIQNQHSSAAKEVLTERHLEWSQNWATAFAKRTCLSKEDGDDLRQQVAIWLHDAVAQYDLSQLKLDKPCLFRSFAGLVIGLRFRDFTRGLKRERGHLSLGIDLLALNASEELESRRIYPAYLRHDPADDDPARLLEANEEFLELQHLLAELSPEDRQLCTAAAKRGLATLANSLHIPYSTAKRYWHQLKSQLRRGLERA